MIKKTTEVLMNFYWENGLLSSLKQGGVVWFSTTLPARPCAASSQGGSVLFLSPSHCLRGPAVQRNRICLNHLRCRDRFKSCFFFQNSNTRFRLLIGCGEASRIWAHSWKNPKLSSLKRMTEKRTVVTGECRRCKGGGWRWRWVKMWNTCNSIEV